MTSPNTAMQARRVIVARAGEELAARFLEYRGVRVVGRNLRAGRGEIDLHGMIGDTSVAFEVKTRWGTDVPGAALSRFSPEKAETVRRYGRLLTPPAYRVDLIGVTLGPDGARVHWIPFAG